MEEVIFLINNQYLIYSLLMAFYNTYSCLNQPTRKKNNAFERKLFFLIPTFIKIKRNEDFLGSCLCW